MVADMFPVRVLVETVRSQHCLGCAHDGNPVVDTYAVVGGQTMLSQLVETVLSALGLPQFIQDSKGLIQINNWKPITFEAITDNPEELVTSLFREISTHITLKILAKRSPSEPNGQCIVDLKQRLLKTAIERQPQILTSSNGQEVKEILQQVISADDECSAWMGAREQREAVNEWLEQIAAEQHKQEEARKSPLSTTRFSPVTELPRLERWFRSDPNPPRAKLLSYANILNAAPYRRANNKVTYHQISNWFTNQRRTAQRTFASRQSSSTTTPLQNGTSKQPMAMLPLNATVPAPPNGVQANGGNMNLALLNSLAQFALANGGMGGAESTQQMHQKLGALFAQLAPTEQEASQQQQQLIPMATGPLDIRSKFDASAAGTSDQHHEQRLLQAQQLQGAQHHHHQTNSAGAGQHSDRMDGGSESPTGNDDLSVTSVTSGGGGGGGLQDFHSSMACSPDEGDEASAVAAAAAASAAATDIMFMDVGDQQQRERPQTPIGRGEQQTLETGAHHTLMVQSGGHCSSPPASPHHHQQHYPLAASSSSAAMAAAAAAAAFQQLMPTAQQQLQLMAMASAAAAATTTAAASPVSAAAAANFVQELSAIKQSPSSHSLNAMMLAAAVKEEHCPSTGMGKQPDLNFTSPISSHQQQRLNKEESGGATATNNTTSNGTQSSRSRLMFDPLSELPILERWFEDNPHPGWLQIEQYTDYLNSMAYRQNYPPISTHNVKIWFKNRRAKTKRLLGGTGDTPLGGSGTQTPSSLAG